jgi:hypothetical protein
MLALVLALGLASALAALALVTASQRLQDSDMHKREIHPALVSFQRWCNAALFMSGAGRETVAGGGIGEGERPRHWWDCRHF